MDNGISQDRLLTLTEFSRIFRRQRWIVIVLVLIVPVVAVALSMMESALYEAKADVLLSRQNLAQSLTGATDPSSFQDPQRFIETQAAIATAPALVRQVIRRENLGMSVSDFLTVSSVAPKANVDLLEFSVSNPDSALAARLATAYAAGFIAFRRNLDTSALASAREDVTAKLSELASAGKQDSALYRSLLDKEQQLVTLETLQTANANLIHPAVAADKIRPRPKRTAAIGVFLGLALGLVFAFIADAFDTKVRSSAEVEEALGLPLLGQIPEPPRRLRNPNQLVMLAEPDSPEAEAFRILRTTLEFTNADADARVMMVTSAMPGEGKSTTTANLAVALAADGSRVTLVDLDLRRPSLPDLLGVRCKYGLTDVVVGRSNVENALVPVPLPAAFGTRSARDPNGSRDRTRAPKSIGRGAFEGTGGQLEVLSAGPTPPNVGEFVGTKRVADLLTGLRDRSDFVLVDVPPLLEMGDALALSTSVEGVLVVARLNMLDRRKLAEFKRTLQRMPTPQLGLILTGTEPISDLVYGGYFSPNEKQQEEPAPTVSSRRSGLLGRSR